MKKYNLVYKGVVILKDITSEEADYQIGLIIINHGYRPEKIPI